MLRLDRADDNRLIGQALRGRFIVVHRCAGSPRTAGPPHREDLVVSWRLVVLACSSSPRLPVDLRAWVRYTRAIRRAVKHLQMSA